jgi:hypothetical protein
VTRSQTDQKPTKVSLFTFRHSLAEQYQFTQQSGKKHHYRLANRGLARYTSLHLDFDCQRLSPPATLPSLTHISAFRSPLHSLNLQKPAPHLEPELRQYCDSQDPRAVSSLPSQQRGIHQNDMEATQKKVQERGPKKTLPIIRREQPFVRRGRFRFLDLPGRAARQNLLVPAAPQRCHITRAKTRDRKGVSRQAMAGCPSYEQEDRQRRAYSTRTSTLLSTAAKLAQSEDPAVLDQQASVE